MSPKEAAAATGIDRLTILKWIRSGKLVATAVETGHGKGYDIRPEDLMQAVQQPRKKRDPKPPTVTGSTLDELQQIKALIEAVIAMGEAQSQAHKAEIHDLRGQLHQTEQRLTEVLRALPAPGGNRLTIWQRLGINIKSRPKE